MHGTGQRTATAGWPGQTNAKAGNRAAGGPYLGRGVDGARDEHTGDVLERMGEVSGCDLCVKGGRKNNMA